MSGWRAFGLGLVLAALGAPPADASHVRPFYGETAGGGRVVAEAQRDGAMKWVAARASTRCRRSGVTVRGGFEFGWADEKRSDRRLSGKATGTSLSSDSERYGATVEGRITGRRHQPAGRPGLERWSGRIHLRAVLYDDGKVVERCAATSVRWTVRRESFGRALWTMTGDERDFISGGGTFTYGGTDEIHATGDRTLVELKVLSVGGPAPDASWEAVFEAPKGQRLVAGRTYRAQRHPFQAPELAGLDISGGSRGCNTLSGSFTVERARFRPNGRMREFAATFEQHCEGAAPALRGRVAFRATTR
jgi:hypothetical protein